MKVVKISTPDWKNLGYQNLGLISNTPGISGIWGNYKFEINNECSECDFWIVLESTVKSEKARVRGDNVFFVTTEEVDAKPSYNSSFLAQFDRIITSRDDINGANVIKSFYVTSWHVKHCYDDLVSNDYSTLKKKKLSVIASDLTFINGHKRRYAFVNKLIGHFKDRIDVFGRGFNEIDDKSFGLINYEFSVAIENSAIRDYFTEKLYDCFVCNTVPVYYGCPNLTDYFNRDSFVSIDLDDFRGAINKIEKLFDTDSYSNFYAPLSMSKNNCLNMYQIFPHLVKFLDGFPDSAPYRNREIKSQQFYEARIKLIKSIKNTVSAARNYLSRW